MRPFQEALIIETDNGDPIEEFTHWMPLPEAPKEEYQFTGRDVPIFEKPKGEE